MVVAARCPSDQVILLMGHLAKSGTLAPELTVEAIQVVIVVRDFARRHVETLSWHRYPIFVGRSLPEGTNSRRLVDTDDFFGLSINIVDYVPSYGSPR
jgi:hypothetical protein